MSAAQEALKNKVIDLTELFHALDANGNGVLQRRELRVLMKNEEKAAKYVEIWDRGSDSYDEHAVTSIYPSSHSSSELFTFQLLFHKFMHIDTTTHIVGRCQRERICGRDASPSTSRRAYRCRVQRQLQVFTDTDFCFDD